MGTMRRTRFVAGAIPPGEHVPTADHRVVLYGVPWAQYEAQLAWRGERPLPRISYLDGAMELMRPSRDHERIKSQLGRLIEAFALVRDVDLSPYGSWTLKASVKEAGAEPDECYLIGDQSRDRPDLVIEVIWTSGGLEKLEVYRRLGVPEVWFWKDDAIQIHVLGPDGYAPRTTSLGLPGIEVAQLLTFLEHPTSMQAVRAYIAALG
jgi:Uma2 family endonuclease